MEKRKMSKAKNKGFTLIEILVVLGLMGIIFLVVIPAINGISDSVKKRQFETKKEILISAAEVYAKNNNSKFNKAFGDSYIIVLPVRTLLYYGYTKADIEDDIGECTEEVGCVINPTDNSSMNNQLITIKKIKSVIQAQWGEAIDFGVNFDLNGAESIEFSSIGCPKSETCTIKAPAIFRDGFDIIGWGATSSSHVSLFEVEDDLEIDDTNNGTTYYAITHKDVEVTFDANGGEFELESNTSRNCSYYNTDNSCDARLDDSDNGPAANRLGYDYENNTKWNTNDTGTGSIVNLASLANDTTAYIKWNIINYSLTIDPNGGDYSSSPSGYTKSGTNYIRSYNIETDTFALPEPGRGGYIFTGWTGTNGIIAQKNLGVLKGNTGDKSYTANWSICPANTYAEAGATSCTACPASHPYSIEGSDSINDCYKVNNIVASNYSYTDCNYSNESAAMAACGTGKTSCTAAPCGTYYYVLNYWIDAYYKDNKGNRKNNYFKGCTSVMRKTEDVEFISTNGDESCNNYLSTSAAGISNPSTFCKSGSASGLTGKCQLSSSDTCNQMLVDSLLRTYNVEGDCYTACTGAAYTGSTNYSAYTVSSVRSAFNPDLGKRVFFVHQANPFEGIISKSKNNNCNGSNSSYYNCLTYSSDIIKFSEVYIKDCKVTKAVYDITSYKLRYKAVTQETKYYPNN